MNKHDLLSIGQLSKLSGVTIRTLRYYDEKNLLKPSYVDGETNYRYYTNEQVLRLQLIKELRYKEFLISEIQEILKTQDISKLIEQYESKKEKIEKDITKLVAIRDRVDTQLGIFKSVSTLANENIDAANKTLSIKTFEERKIFTIRKHSPFSFNSVSFRFLELLTTAINEKLNIKNPYMIIFHEGYNTLNTLYSDYEVSAILDKNNEIKDKHKSYISTLNSGLYAALTIQGSYEKTICTYKKFLSNIKNSGYKIIGPPIKIYLTNILAAKSVDKMLSELQIPVKK